MDFFLFQLSLDFSHFLEISLPICQIDIPKGGLTQPLPITLLTVLCNSQRIYNLILI